MERRSKPEHKQAQKGEEQEVKFGLAYFFSEKRKKMKVQFCSCAGEVKSVYYVQLRMKLWAHIINPLNWWQANTLNS